MAVAERHAAELTVKQRLGLHPNAPVELVPDLHIEPFAATAALRREAITDSPRLWNLRLAHQSAEAALALEVTRQWPDLTLWPTFEEEKRGARAAMQFTLPLPIWLGNDPAIARAKAQRQTTAEALRTQLEQLIQALAIAEVRLAASTELAQHWRDELVPLAQQQVEAGRQLANAGQFDALLILDALLRNFDVRTQAIAAAETQALTTISINTLLADPEAGSPWTRSDRP